MEDVLDIPEVYEQDGGEQPKPKPVVVNQAPAPTPILTPDNQKKLDKIVSLMVDNGESDADIKKIIGEFKTQKSIPEHQLNHTQEQDQEHFNQNDPIFQSGQRLTKNITDLGDKAIDEITGNRLREDYYNSIQPTVGKQDASYVRPVVPDFRFKDQIENDRNNFKQELANPATSDYATTHVINTIARQNPAKRGEIEADLYTQKAAARGADPATILANKKKIEDRDYNFNILHGTLEEPKGALPSILVGLHNRNQALDDYDYFSNHSDQQNIDYLNKNVTSRFDPDKAIPTPAGFGQFTAPVGSEGIATVKSAAAGTAVGLVPGMEELAPMAAVAASSPEYYKRGYATALGAHYTAEKAKGLSDQDAYAKAKDMAEFDAKADVVQGAAGTALGTRFGLRGEPINLSNGLKAAGVDLLKNSGAIIKSWITEGGLNATAGVAAQVAKNLHSGRPAGEGIEDAAFSQFLFPIALGALIKGAHSVGELGVGKILQGVSKVPKPQVQDELYNMTKEGSITPEQALQVNQTIDEHKALDSKIPDNVKSEDTRLQIHDLINQRNDLEAKKEVLDPAYHAGIKSQIGEINDKINSLSRTTIPEEGTPKEMKVDPIEIGKNLLADVLEKKTAPFLEESLIYKGLAKSNPEEMLKFIADQAQLTTNVNGEEVSSRAETDRNFGKDLVDKAVELFPTNNKENEANAAKAHEEWLANNKPPVLGNEENELNSISKVEDKIKQSGAKSISQTNIIGLPSDMNKSDGIPSFSDIGAFEYHNDINDYKGKLIDIGGNVYAVDLDGKMKMIPFVELDTKTGLYKESERPDRAIKYGNSIPESGSFTVIHGSPNGRIEKFDEGSFGKGYQREELPHERFSGVYTDDNTRDNKITSKGYGQVHEYSMEFSKSIPETEANKILKEYENKIEKRLSRKEATNYIKSKGYDMIYRDNKDGTYTYIGLDVNKIKPKEIQEKPESKISVIKPEENTHPNIVNLKTENDAIPEQSTDDVGIREPQKMGEDLGAGNTIPKEPTGESKPEANVENTGEEEVTSIKNEVTRIRREQHGLREEIPHAEKEFGKTWDEAKQKIEDGYHVQDLVDELKNKPRPLTDVENAMLLHHQNTKELELESVNSDINKAAEKGDQAGLAEAKTRRSRLLDELQDLYDVNKKVGTENARGLASRKMMVDRKYSLANMLSEKRAANDGKPLTEEQTDKVQKQFDEIQRTNKAMADRITELEKQVDELKKSKSEKITPEKSIKEKGKTLADKIRKLKKDKGTLSIDFTLGTWDLAIEGVATLVEGGATIADAIDRMVKDGKVAFKTDKDKEVFTRVLNNIEEEGKHYNLLDPTLLKLKAQNERAMMAYDHDLAKDENAKLSTFKKAQNVFLKWQRAFKLSNPLTMGKLMAAAATRFTTDPAERIVGGAISAALPKLAAKAEGEGGGLNIKIQAKAIADGMTQGMADAASIIKKGDYGKSDLDVVFGKRGDLPPEAIDFFGQLHSATKAPVKRFIFKRSLETRLAANIKNGVDVTDPMVQMRIATSAYKDANRAIFMQDNFLSNSYQNWVSSMEKSKEYPQTGKAASTFAQWMIPFVKVPTNIVGETAATTPLGLAIGGAKLLHTVFTKGIKNLSTDEADMIMRNLKKGSIGTGALLFGYFHPHTFGGYYQEKEKRKASDAKAMAVKIGGVNIPAWLIESPIFQSMQLGATIRRVKDAKESGKAKGISEGVWAGALGLGEHLPMVDQPLRMSKVFTDAKERKYYLGELAKSTVSPALLTYVAKATDQPESKSLPQKIFNPEETRAPRTIAEHVESGIPGLRENVPLKKKSHPHGERTKTRERGK